MMKEKYGISVLMSVYKSEKADYLYQAVESILHQTRKPDEVVIVEDGPLTEELYNILDRLEKDYAGLIYRYPLDDNKGLGLALKYGVEKCRYSLIARMDTDDISIPERLELQEKAFSADENMSIVGGHIREFMIDPSQPISYRYVPLEHEAIAQYQRKRSAFNHMTVMFKKFAVIKAGNYEHGLYMEDDLLWHNMIATGSKMRNLDKVLCFVRVGEGMYERRGGFSYFKNYKAARKIMLYRGQISSFDYHYSILVQFIVALIPTNFRKTIFMKLLRS